MQPVIKSIYSTDIPDLDHYLPDEEDCFGFNLRLMIGLKDEEGEESFDTLVITPKWLIKNHNEDDIIIGRHHLIVFHYDIETIRRFLDKYVSSCSGDTWDEVASKLSRLGLWEFEDYRSRL